MRPVRNLAKPPARPALTEGLRRRTLGVDLATLFASTALFNQARAQTKRDASDPSLESPGIAAALKAMQGGTFIVPPGRHHVANLVIPANLTIYAPQGASIIGDLIGRGPNTVVRGLTFEAGTVDISHSVSVSVGDCRFIGGQTSIRVDRATKATIINNDFRDVVGGVISGWSFDESRISGNHFYDCAQCIDLHFNSDHSKGRNIVIERNMFTGTARMPIEVGPIGAYTLNLIVRDNWAVDFKNRGPDPGETMSTFVAYSIVPTRGVNTSISGNYALAGSRGRGGVGIELDGSGEIVGNYTEDFDYGAIVYGAGHKVHGNTFARTSVFGVMNYARRPGEIGPNRSSGERRPAPPERRSWPQR